MCQESDFYGDGSGSSIEEYSFPEAYDLVDPEESSGVASDLDDIEQSGDNESSESEEEDGSSETESEEEWEDGSSEIESDEDTHEELENEDYLIVNSESNIDNDSGSGWDPEDEELFETARKFIFLFQSKHHTLNVL